MRRADGARRREDNEVEFSRIVAFSDGVFAIAITLLVLNLGLEAGLAEDEVWGAIWGQREQFLAFAISFAVIGRFWVVHHRFFATVRAFDGRLMALNMLYLACIVLLPFSSEVLGEYGGQTPSVVVYAANLIACVAVGMWMSADARGAGLTEQSEEDYREGRVHAAFIALVFGASIPVAFLAPNLASLLWLTLFFGPLGLVRLLLRRV